MTQLRPKMLEELQRRNYLHSAKTYVRIIRDFAQHFHQPPDKLGPEQMRQFQAYLFQTKKLTAAGLNIIPSQRDGAQGGFGGDVVDLEAPVGAVPGQRRPQRERIADRRRVRLAGKFRQRECEPVVQGLQSDMGSVYVSISLQMDTYRSCPLRKHELQTHSCPDGRWRSEPEANRTLTIQTLVQVLKQPWKWR